MPGEMTGQADDEVRIPGLDADRRVALRMIGRGLGVLAGGFLGPIGPASPAWAGRADTALDIQVLQTASSLETLVIDLYSAALGTGPLGRNAPSAVAIAAMPDLGARDTLVKLLTDTQARHREHRLAFQTLTTALGGRQQNDPNPKYASGSAAADVSNPLRLVDYAAVLEKILVDTYTGNLTVVDDVKTKEALAAALAVDAQHLAVLRMVGALLRDDTSQLVRIPIGNDLVRLPATLAAIAVPQAIDDVTSSAVAEPESGAVIDEVTTTSSVAGPESGGVTGDVTTTSSVVASESGAVPE
jgi:hypothetical protein